MNVSQILKSVKSEVTSFIDAKKVEKRNLTKKGGIPNNFDRFVKSNSNDLMDVKTATRYVNGVCYANGG
ncbi:MAG: hypothetical protein H7263_17835 [Candidatus Sericytochromatia bacterium]|nr:hypothetical protein [Candidatus Sericytochromatia bacterium]